MWLDRCYWDKWFQTRKHPPFCLGRQWEVFRLQVKVLVEMTVHGSPDNVNASTPPWYGQRYVRLNVKILHDQRLSPVEKLVAGAFAYYVDANGLGWPSTGSVAKDLQISTSTVKRSFRKLEQYGYLVTVQSKRTIDGGLLVKRRLTDPNPDQPLREATHEPTSPVRPPVNQRSSCNGEVVNYPVGPPVDGDVGSPMNRELDPSLTRRSSASKKEILEDLDPCTSSKDHLEVDEVWRKNLLKDKPEGWDDEDWLGRPF